MSNNDEEFDINDLFIQAAFGEDLANFYEQWKEADTIDEHFNIINSPNLITYARASVTNLVELVESLIIEINKQNNTGGRFTAHQHYIQLKSSLEANLSWMYPELSAIKSKIPQMRKLIQRWQDDETSEAAEGGATGGLIGFAFGGPIGAFVGGAIGGLLSSSDLESDVKADFQALLDEYSGILSRLAICIQENIKIAERFLVEQIESLPEPKQKAKGFLQAF